jgi:sugar/nucleoside kinase (ribokinase family)
MEQVGVQHAAHPPAADTGPPAYLVIGHVTRDVVPGGFVYGGTVTYAALAAVRLGLRAAVVSAGALEPGLRPHFEGVDLHMIPSEQTTTFENVYTAAGRRQYVRAVAAPIPGGAIPPAWRGAPIVHLGPLVQEIADDLVDLFPAARIVATPQGWLRTWDASGLVRPTTWTNAEHVLARTDVLVFSPEDVGGDQELVRRYATMAPIGVVTEARNGCTVWHRGRSTHYPPFEAEETDATGAGDVFAAAFLVRYAETEDIPAAARFANCVAAMAVEGRGTTMIPTREQVEERLRTGRVRT